MGMMSPSIAGQVPVPSSVDGPHRSSNIDPVRPSRNPSNASSVARGKDSGLNQRMLTTHVGRGPVKIPRKKLPRLDGPQQFKPGESKMPGSFEASEKSFETINTPTTDLAATAPLDDATTTQDKRASVRSIGNDPMLRAVGSTPSLRNRRSSVPRSRTLSLTSDPRPGVKPTPTKQHARRALGVASEYSAKVEDYTPSEYSTTRSSDLDHGSCASCDSPGPKAGAAVPSPPPIVGKRPLVIPRPPVPPSPSRDRGNLIPDTVVKRVSTVLRSEPRGRSPVNKPKKQTLHELPTHLVPSSTSTSPELAQAGLSSNVRPRTPRPSVAHPTGVRRQNRSLSRAVTGLEDLMEDAMHVAKDAADNGHPDEVAHILDSAAAVLRRASLVIPRRELVAPFAYSPHESGDSSDDSDSEYGVHSGFSTAMHSRDVSAGTAPTLLTKSANSSAQPVLVERYTGRNGKAPASLRATANHIDLDSDDDDYSIAPTPPRLYQPESAESIVRDFAYARMQNERAQAAGTLSAPHRDYGAAADFYGDHGKSVVSQPGLRRSIALSKMPTLPYEKPLPGVPAAVVSPEKDSVTRLKRGAGRRDMRVLEPEPTETEPLSRADGDSAMHTVPQRRKKGHRPGLSDLFTAPISSTRHAAAGETTNARTLSGITDNRSVPAPAPFAPPPFPPPAPRWRTTTNFATATTPEEDAAKQDPRRHISLQENQGFSLGRYHRRQPIAREWDTLRKRITAAIACANTVFIGLIAGIYAGEVPKIQYQLQDESHKVILGNVLLFIGLGITTLIFWPLPLLHGRKPYTLLAFALMLPLQFPQALAVSGYRNPENPIYRCGLLIPRVLTGLAMGFANINQLPTLFDLFGCSLMSEKPHQELVSQDDIRRQGGGVGIWLGIWSFCFVGSLSIGFCIGACIISGLDPSWGFYIVVILLAFFLLVNVIAPETRRAPYRRSITQFFDESEPEKLRRRVARGEVKLHIENEGPKWWWQEVWAGVKLTTRMVLQPGFFVLMVYIAWIYAQITLVILLLGALLSREYTWPPQYVGLASLSLAIGALFSLPLAKASVFSRSRFTPQRTDSMTMRPPRLTWSSHLFRRCMFTLLLPFAGLAYTLSSPGPTVSWASPTVFCGLVGFLSNLAIAECVGLIMEVFDTCDLQPGVNTKHRQQSMSETTKRRRTNYSSFPRVCAGFFAAQGLGFFLAAASTGVSGAITRALGAQTAVAVVAGILLVITLLFMFAMFRWKEVQVIPSSVFDRATKRGSIAWGAVAEDPEWKPVVIGNPSGKMRRVNLLEMGSLTRWTEIRRLNHLVRK
ncbi:hypothetical protein LTR22_008297 [Elasticomyces elasticus]|nr:hypothetical protein LTR22_008297 [Elasticomyces elasticus]KAK4904804.1 hypothetical protein LTR49_025809 [Elasticomyces elasticus]KAK5768126.1 hypothetical protein LTS12_001610 [Elasticomyces elasticus]